MQDSYLNVNLLSYVKKEDVSEDAANIILIATKEQSERYAFQKSLVQNIGKAFAENRTEVITTLGDKQNFITITPNKETELLRLAGASLYTALQKQQTRTARLRGLEELTEVERYAFLEGMLLSSYDFNKYKTKKKQLPIEVYIRNRSFPKDKITELKTVAEAVSLTKTLVNEPVNYMDALQFSSAATEAGKQFGFETEILHKEQIEELKMGGVTCSKQRFGNTAYIQYFSLQARKCCQRKTVGACRQRRNVRHGWLFAENKREYAHDEMRYGRRCGSIGNGCGNCWK